MALLLFHSEVFIPAAAANPIFEGRLTYGYHARNEALSDRYGEIPLPSHFFAEGAKLIEAEFCTQRLRLTKQVWRQPLDDYRDLALVLSTGGFVRTVWVNVRSDTHKSLNKSKYITAFDWRKRIKSSVGPATSAQELCRA